MVSRYLYINRKEMIGKSLRVGLTRFAGGRELLAVQVENLGIPSFFYGCLPFVRTIAARRKREAKRSAKRESIYRVSRNVSVNVFLASNNNTTYSFFFSYRSATGSLSPKLICGLAL